MQNSTKILIVLWLRTIDEMTCVYSASQQIIAIAALASGGKTTGAKGALRSVLDAPLGDGLLAIVALGLLCFALWRAMQALADADHLGREPKALARRAAYAGS